MTPKYSENICTYADESKWKHEEVDLTIQQQSTGIVHKVWYKVIQHPILLLLGSSTAATWKWQRWSIKMDWAEWLNNEGVSTYLKKKATLPQWIDHVEDRCMMQAIHHKNQKNYLLESRTMATTWQKNENEQRCRQLYVKIKTTIDWLMDQSIIQNENNQANKASMTYFTRQWMIIMKTTIIRSSRQRQGRYEENMTTTMTCCWTKPNAE